MTVMPPDQAKPLPAPSSRPGLNPFAGARDYLLIFRRHLGRRLYLVFFLALLAALTEGLGIALLLPLLGALDTGMGAAGNVPAPLVWLLDTLGLGSSLVGILLLIAGVFLFKGLIAFSHQAYGGYLQAQLLRELKARLFTACSRMSYGYYVSRNTGHFINVINTQVNAFFQSFTAYKSFLNRLIQAVAYLTVALLLAWQFGVMMLVLGLLLLVCFTRLNRYVQHLSRQVSLEMSQLNKLLVQALQAFKYLTSTQEMDRLGTGVERSVHRLTGYQVRQQLWSAFTHSISEPLSVTFIILAIIVQVAVLQQPLAPILVAILLLHRGMGALLQVQASWQSTLNTIGSVEMVEAELAALDAHREQGGDRVIGPLRREIRLSDVSFAYRPELGDVLSRISLAIPARTTVAFVGESGAGKSTLVDLLTLLLKPQSGEVSIDGVPGPEIELASWRRQIGYVSQETVVFDDTIAANIALADVDPEADADLLARVRIAAHRAHLAHFIDTLPEGYQTVVGDRGIRLSGGQRQRLFIARELFKRPNLLILDEATSALDSESEREIQRSIDELKGSMTVVIIAHRLSTIRNADRVYVLDHGRLIEQGAYDELSTRRESRFKTMVELQALG